MSESLERDLDDELVRVLLLPKSESFVELNKALQTMDRLLKARDDAQYKITEEEWQMVDEHRTKLVHCIDRLRAEASEIGAVRLR